MTVIKEPKGDFFDDVYTLLHPTRFRIVKLLNEKSMHIDRRDKPRPGRGKAPNLIGMHLDILELYGFVSSERVISEEGQLKGRVTRIVRLTDKVAKVCSELQKELQPLT